MTFPPTPATPADQPGGAPEDVGLLAPGRAGSPAEAATGDAAFLQAMLDAEAALARAQATVGRVPDAAAGAITAAARVDAFDARELALAARAGGNPVIPLVAALTAAVARADPAAARHVHAGATSQDVLDTATMLVARRTLRLVRADLARTAEALAELATAHRRTPLPGRTLTQHAVPTTFGLKVAGWYTLVREARTRLGALRLPAQLGGAAGTLAAFAAGDPPPATRRDGAAPPSGPRPGPRGREEPEDDIGVRLLAAYAREVGLAEPVLPWHTLRTPVAELAAALAVTVGALGKLAADVLVLSRTEIGELAEGGGGGSSAMPHKSNPVRATLIAAAARQAPALAAVPLGSLAAADERPAGAWHAEWQPLRELLRLAGGAAHDAAELVAGLRVDAGRMRKNLDLTGGLVVSERLTAALAPELGRARAGALVTAAARRAAAEGRPLGEALLAEARLVEEVAVAELLPPRRLKELTDPTTYLGSAPVLVDRALRAGRTAGEAAP
ncbi:3-carboxy-cis,cis-muconate cycloisomerase [Streptomyces sp. B6B3]|uniref:3-carboxy-cis,cis-muconate cycloisomerase n=1 Tax=Streptomyces sp. B6B3 TaxID=3153570 RepID=UPI00325D561B